MYGGPGLDVPLWHQSADRPRGEHWQAPEDQLDAERWIPHGDGCASPRRARRAPLPSRARNAARHCPPWRAHDRARRNRACETLHGIGGGRPHAGNGAVVAGTAVREPTTEWPTSSRRMRIVTNTEGE
jgi:hypothetical protein